MRVTPCECDAAGWCARHGCQKTWGLVELCRRLPDWFEIWERGRGPGQSTATETRRKDATDCTLRGAELRREQCPSCQGRVEIRVFACALHDSCTIAKPLSDTACCASCGDFTSAELDHPVLLHD